MKVRFAKPTYSVSKISAIISISGFIMGMDISSLAVFLGKKHFEEKFKMPGSLEQGLLVGASPLGGLIGCLLYAILVGKLGRVTSFRVGCMLWVKGSMINVLAFNLWMVILARGIKGITAGLFSILIAAYIGEVIPKQKKGQTMALIPLSFSLSILLVYYLCIGLNSLKSQLSFRLTWAIEAIPAVGLFVFTLWLPESPEWLTLHGDYLMAEEIQNNLAKEYNRQNRGNPVKLLNKLDLAMAYQESSEKFRFKDFLRENYWKQTLMGATLQLLVQFSGINILMYYIIFICDMIGLEGTVRIVSASIPYMINSALSLLPITFMDHVRRKDITLAGGFPLGIIMVAIGTLMGINGHKVEPINGNKSLVWVVDRNTGPLVMGLCFLFVAVFSVTLSCGPWIYTNELLPTKARAKGLPICMSIGWLANFSLTLLGPTMLASLKWRTFVLLGAITLAISIAILVFFPDTKDLSQIEIDSLYLKLDIKDKGYLDTGKEQSDDSNDLESNITPQNVTPIIIIDQRRDH